MGKMKVYTHEEMLDIVIGVKGTPEREKYDAEINDFLIGNAVREAREAKHLTQEQLAELMGVKRVQVSRIENGKNISFSSIRRAFRALGVPSANLELESLGKMALW